MLLRDSEFVRVNWPVCGIDVCNLKFKKNGISNSACNSCLSFYVNPKISSEVLEWYYQGSHNYRCWNEVIFPLSESLRLERTFVTWIDCLLELCLKYKVETNSILEIGAGYGTYCQEVKIRNLFNRVVAVEPCPKLAITCRPQDL